MIVDQYSSYGKYVDLSSRKNELTENYLKSKIFFQLYKLKVSRVGNRGGTDGREEIFGL